MTLAGWLLSLADAITDYFISAFITLSSFVISRYAISPAADYASITPYAIY
jgi:hypothetical protein